MHYSRWGELWPPLLAGLIGLVVIVGISLICYRVWG